jgi:hypothetical protein
MSNNPSVSNNEVYSEQTEYKDRLCIGLRCKKSKTYLYQLSLTIGSYFLCTDCKRSVERAGWITERIASEYGIDKEKQNSNRQLKVKDDFKNIKRIKKDNNSCRAGNTC